MHTYGIRNDKSRQSGASGGLTQWPWFSVANLRCDSCFDSTMWSRSKVFLLSVAQDRKNPDVGAKNACRWLRYAGGHLNPCT